MTEVLAVSVVEAAEMIEDASMSAMQCPCVGWPRPCAYHLGMRQGLAALVEWVEDRQRQATAG